MQRRDHDALYRLAESLIELDEWCQTWRVRHYRVVARVIGDAVVKVSGMGENIAAISTFANAFTLNCLVIHTVAKLVERGIEPPVWRSGNAPGGDEANAKFIARFAERVRWL